VAKRGDCRILASFGGGGPISRGGDLISQGLLRLAVSIGVLGCPGSQIIGPGARKANKGESGYKERSSSEIHHYLLLVALDCRLRSQPSTLSL